MLCCAGRCDGLFFSSRANPGCVKGIQQFFGMVMARTAQQFTGRCLLHDASVLHDSNVVGHAGGGGEVMINIEQGKTVAGLQVFQQAKNARLAGQVKARDWLVCNNQRAFSGQRQGYHKPVEHAAAQFKRVTGQYGSGIGKAHFAQAPSHGGFFAPARHAASVSECFAKSMPYGEKVVEAVTGVLHDQRGSAPGNADTSFFLLHTGRQQVHDSHGGERFAGSAGPHKGQCFPCANAQGNMVHKP